MSRPPELFRAIAEALNDGPPEGLAGRVEALLGGPAAAAAGIGAAAALEPDAARDVAAAAARDAGAAGEFERTLTTFLQLIPHNARRHFGTGAVGGPPAALADVLPKQLPRFRPGDRPAGIGDWVLERLLGVGGFGEVWMARHAHFDGIPPVAVKFCLDPDARRRLVGGLAHEAAVLNQVMKHGRHPHIVQLLDGHLETDPPCLKYEYVAGGTLPELAREWPMPPDPARVEIATRCVRDLADTVGHMHRLSPPVVHRDLKPANVLVERGEGRAPVLRITDFGISGLSSVEEEGPGGTHRSGTRGYAPVQQLSMGLPPDPRDDVHALGVIWFQLLANDPKAFPDPESPARTREHLDRWGVPPPLAELLGACVAEDPARRPADGTVLAGRLGALLGRPTARPASTGAAETLPGYVVGEKLGRGDLAVVYKALQTGTGRTVAVKVFHAAEQFARREAEALAALDHPNIVRIHDSRTHNGRVYQVREFVEGASLHQAVRRHRPTVAAAAGLLARVATVVAHVHTHGIVHCDLTPGNILLARNPEQAAADPLAGTIKLAGFHLAVRPGRDPYPAGWVAGSPGYLSPEQALGQTDKIGPASDVWALAVILYELLTGTNPFAPRGGTRTFRETVFAEAPPPTRLRPDVPEELESLLIVCLRKDPARRIASAAELATELARFAGMSPAKPAARGWSLFGRRSR